MIFGKRGFFFILDAILAIGILVIGVLFLTSSYIQLPQLTQVSFLSDDLLSFLSDTKIKDLNNEYAGIGGELWKNGTISNQENSLLQQASIFYKKNDLGTAEKFIQSSTNELVPSQFRYEVWIDKTLIYPRNPSSQHSLSRNQTSLILASRKIAFGFLNQSTGEIWGPYEVEVYLWQK